MSNEYCSPPLPVPLAIIAAPLVCGSVALTHAAKVKAGLLAKSRTAGAGVPELGMVTTLAVDPSALKLNAPLVKPVTQTLFKSANPSNVPRLAFAEESAAELEPLASSN